MKISTIISVVGNRKTQIIIFLLVCIAIIAIWFSTVSSLNTARWKGPDAVIQSNLATVRTQAELYYSGDGGNTYGAPASTCFTGMFAADKTIAIAIADADTANKSGVVVCNSTPTAYAVSAQFAINFSQYWCIDSMGREKRQIETLGLSTVCPPEDLNLKQNDISPLNSLLTILSESLNSFFEYVFELFGINVLRELSEQDGIY